MAAPLFYNQGDQDIYNSGSKFVPQEKYRLGYTAPTKEEKITETFGIPNTNAFTNSGSSFNQSGNAFGYGSPVSEVNVRTFNPQSNDPTGKIANAQTMYNKASADLKDPFNRLAQTETFTGMRPSKQVMDYYNNQIMDNKEQYGAQGQYTSPYDDTVDQSKYTTTIGSFPSQAFFNRLRNKGFNIAENIPYIGLPARILKSILPEQEDRGPGGGNYGIGGLSDDQKVQYNALAKEGMLFNGQNGFKTLTGKNFTGKGYLEGQLDIYNDKFAGMSEDDIEELKNDPRKQFKYKQYLESSQMYKTKKAQEKNKENMANLKAAESRRESARQYDPAVHGKNNYGLGADGKQSYDSGQGFGTNATSGGPVSNKTGRGRTDYMEGGRAGYFFGGRARLQGGGRINFRGGGMDMGNESNQTQSANMGGGATGDFSTGEQTMNHNRAMRDNQKPPESPIKNIIDAGSEISYLNNLKNLNLPGLALNFGVNKFRNFIGNKKTKEEEDKLSYNTNTLPTNNYMAKVTKQDLARYTPRNQKELIDKTNYIDAKDQFLINPEMSKYEFEEMKKGNITEPGTYVGANGGRVNFKNGGLASIL